MKSMLLQNSVLFKLQHIWVKVWDSTQTAFRAQPFHLSWMSLSRAGIMTVIAFDLNLILWSQYTNTCNADSKRKERGKIQWQFSFHFLTKTMFKTEKPFICRLGFSFVYRDKCYRAHKFPGGQQSSDSQERRGIHSISAFLAILQTFWFFTNLHDQGKQLENEKQQG